MITVMVVDDQELMRTALEHFVSLAEDMQTVPGAADGKAGLEAAREHRPDVILMDM